MKNIILSLTAFLSLISISSFSSDEHRELQRVRQREENRNNWCERIYHTNVGCPKNGLVEIPREYFRKFASAKDRNKRLYRILAAQSVQYNCSDEYGLYGAYFKSAKNTEFCKNRVKVDGQVMLTDIFEACFNSLSQTCLADKILSDEELEISYDKLDKNAYYCSQNYHSWQECPEYGDHEMPISHVRSICNTTSNFDKCVIRIMKKNSKLYNCSEDTVEGYHSGFERPFCGNPNTVRTQETSVGNVFDICGMFPVESYDLCILRAIGK